VSDKVAMVRALSMAGPPGGPKRAFLLPG